MALICLFPLSGENAASFPHVFVSSGLPPVPNPILESQVTHCSSLLLVIPILALDSSLLLEIALNPSLLQYFCKEACGPISDFHVLRPSEVARYWPSAINECSELACLWMVTNLILWPIFIPRQILEKGVFQ